MAQESALQTYDSVGNKEQLMEVITNISPMDTVVFSSAKKVKAEAVYVEWLTDALATASEENAKIEGADYSFEKLTARTRTGNWTQILNKPIEVAGTQEAVNKAGLESEYAYQTQKALKELARDIEKSLLLNTGASGASGTARTLKGIEAWITTNVQTGTGTGSEALTETMYNNMLQTIYEAGGNPDVTLAPPFQKRAISQFSTPSQRQINVEDKRLITSVDIYESDFGLQKIKTHRYMTTSVVACLQMDMWEVAVLRPVKTVEVAKVGDALRGVAETELTLVSRNEKASGKITGLTTS